MVAIRFNALDHKPNVALEPVPTGPYIVIITNSTEKPNSKGDGSFIEVEMTIQQGEYAGQKVFERLNLNNRNDQAVEIASRTLSSICHVCGVIDLQDTQQLHGRPFMAQVAKIARNDDPNRSTNVIRGYKFTDGRDPGTQGQQSQGQAPNWAANGTAAQAQPQVPQPQPQQVPQVQYANFAPSTPPTGPAQYNTPQPQYALQQAPQEPQQAIQQPIQPQPPVVQQALQQPPAWNGQQALQQPPVGSAPPWVNNRPQ